MTCQALLESELFLIDKAKANFLSWLLQFTLPNLFV